MIDAPMTQSATEHVKAQAVGAHYDTVLRSALRQFFERAMLEAEPTPSVSGDAKLTIEPSANPAALIIRWSNTRYTLRVPSRWPFTSHEVRLAKVIGHVLAARSGAILDPTIIGNRGDLFRGLIEDRYVGAFLDHRDYTIESRTARADRIASIIELLRMAALSSYENRPISTGVILLGGTGDPVRKGRAPLSPPTYAEVMTSTKSVYRLADGVRTVFMANSEGRILDIVDIERWGREACQGTELQVPCAQAFEWHARVTLQQEHVCAVLSPSREIKIFARGAELFTFRGAGWHLLDLQAKYRLWADAVGDHELASCIFQTALNLADAREGALFLVARDPQVAVGELVAPADRLDSAATVATTGASRRDLLHLLEGRAITDLDPSVLAALASLDGAMVTDRSGRLLAAGAILRHTSTEDVHSGDLIEGARTTAAMAASKFGAVLKVSEDGIITFFDGDRVWDI